MERSRLLRGATVLLLLVGICWAAGSWIFGPSIPELFLERACFQRRADNNNVTSCAEDKAAQAEAASRAAYFSLAFSIPNFLSVGAIATLADHSGRKVALLTTIIGFIMLTGAVLLIPGSKDACFGGTCVDGFWPLLVLTALFSLTGGTKGTVTVVFTVMSDLTRGSTPRACALGFALIEAASFGGQIPGLILVSNTGCK